MKLSSFEKGLKYVAEQRLLGNNYNAVVDSFATNSPLYPTSTIEIKKGDVLTVKYISRVTNGGIESIIVGFDNNAAIYGTPDREFTQFKVVDGAIGTPPPPESITPVVKSSFNPMYYVYGALALGVIIVIGVVVSKKPKA